MPLHASTPRPGTNIEGSSSSTIADLSTIINHNSSSNLSLTDSDKTGVSEKGHLNDSSGETSYLIQRPHHFEVQQLEKVARRYQMNPNLARQLIKLRGYEIVIVSDNSGSMSTLIHGTQQTRWQYLMKMVLGVLEIAVIFDSNGVDIYFLNRVEPRNVKDPSEVRALFDEEPSGYTPLVPIVEKIFRLPASKMGHEKKLLVFVATDGAPTDEYGNDQTEELKRLMSEERNVETTFVQFLACTDELEKIKYLTDWDRKMKNVDVTTDYHSQRTLFYERFANKRSFSKGDYLAKAVWAPSIQKSTNGTSHNKLSIFRIRCY